MTNEQLRQKIKVDKDIPVAINRYEAKYPFGQMEVGDSFHCEDVLNARSAAYIYGKHHGVSFTSRIDTDTGKASGRVWRTA